jgi:hypothetical protein
VLVLFGDEACLQESQSDLLLEKCRRAFKKVEGGGESGFIAVDNFGEVVDELNLRRRLGGDHGVQTLKAFLEVCDGTQLMQIAVCLACLMFRINFLWYRSAEQE